MSILSMHRDSKSDWNMRRTTSQNDASQAQKGHISDNHSGQQSTTDQEFRKADRGSGTVFLSDCESTANVGITILRNTQRDCHSHQVCE